MSIIALLCIVVSLAAVQMGMRGRGTSNTFLKLFAVCLVVSLLFTSFFATGRRTASRVRTSVETRMRHRDNASSKRYAGRPARLPVPPESPWRELPAPPVPPTPAYADGAIRIDGSSDGDDSADAEKDAFEVEPPDSAEWEAVQAERPDGEPSRSARDGWDGLSDGFTNFFEKVADRSSVFAERAAARAEGLRARVDQFRAECTEGNADDEHEAAADDADSHDEEATQPDEDTDANVGHRSPSRRGPGTLMTILASSAILYVGYLFLDANTRGQFTWSLRIASLFAFAGIIAAVISSA